MKYIAVDMSSPEASMALLEEGKVIQETTWTQQRRSGQQLFDYLEQMMREWLIGWKDIGGYVCGRGPGNYSGLRMAITALQALGLPDALPLYCLNSGAAVAQSIFDKIDNAVEHVVVVGNARRQRLWYGVFQQTAAGAQLQNEWQLTKWEEIAEQISGKSVCCVSSCYDELRNMPEFGCVAGLNWEMENVYPSAACLGQVVYLRMQQNIETEPPVPVYMHPPVNTEIISSQEKVL